MFEINPQEVMMIAEEMIRGGWVQGKIKEPARSHNSDEDPQGVCLLGALQEACTKVVSTGIRSVLEQEPDFRAFKPAEQTRLINRIAGSMSHRLATVFQTRLLQVLGSEASSIPSWNDATDRKKAEVVAAMQATLEIVTQECLEAWSDPVVQHKLVEATKA